MPAYNTEIEKRLWHAADELRANSKLKASEYSVPVLGLIFLRYADHKFSQVEGALAKSRELGEELNGDGIAPRRKVGKTDYQARGVLYLPDKARLLPAARLARRTTKPGGFSTCQTRPVFRTSSCSRRGRILAVLSMRP